MNKSKIWRKCLIFGRNIEINMPLEYEMKNKSDNHYLFCTDDGKRVIINELRGTKFEGNKILLNIYRAIKDKRNQLSEPVFSKRSWRKMEQYMLYFTTDNKQSVIFVVVGGLYLIEFVYSGTNRTAWKQECEYIVNTIRIGKGGDGNGN